jgi:hypothetical protein
MNINEMKRQIRSSILQDSHVRVPWEASIRRLAQEFADGRGQFVRTLEKKAYLPEFRFRQAVAKSGHAGEPDSVLRLPIGFPRRIICDALLVQADKRRWIGIHSKGDCRGRPIRRAVTYHALCLVDFRAGGQVSLGRLDWGRLVRLTVDGRVERNMSEKSFERQRLSFGRHGHSAEFDEKEGGQRNYAKTNDDA